MSIKRILITGGAGFIASHIIEALLKNEYEVAIIDNFTTGNQSNIEAFKDTLDVYVGNISNYDLISYIMKSFRPDAVFHLAAQPSLAHSVKHPIYDASVNAIGTISLLNAMRENNVDRIVFASTSAIYPATEKKLVETLAKAGQPDSPYGISKLCAEYYIRYFLPDHVIFRLANIYGPRQVPIGENQVIPQAIKHMLLGEPFQFYNNGVHTRDFMYAEDVAKAFITALKSPAFGTFNLSTGKSPSVMSVLTILKDISGWEGEWVTVEKYEKRPHVRIDNKKFRQTFSMKNFVSIEEGLKMTFSWWKEQYEKNS